MRLITRYLLTELATPFLLGLVLFTSLLIFGQMFKLTDYVINRGVPVVEILSFVFSGIPQTLPFTAPMALVLSVLMVYGRLAGDNELTVLRASGVPLRSLVLPVLLVGLTLTGAIFALRQFVYPSIGSIRNQQLARMKLINPVGLLQPGTFHTLKDYTIYAEEINGSVMKRVQIWDHQYDPPMQITSRQGRWVPQRDGLYRLVLRDGTMHQRGEEGGYRVLNFNQHAIQIRVGEISQDVLELEPEQQSITQLVGTYNRAYNRWVEAREGFAELTRDQESPDPAYERARNRLDRALHERRDRGVWFHRAVALPFASFFLVLVAAPVGMLAKRSGKSIGLAMSLVLILVYYLLLSVAEPFAMNGWVPVWTAIWTPNLVFGMAGATLFGYLYRSQG